MSKRASVILFTISSAVIALDQVSKGWVLNRLEPGEISTVLPGFFNLTLTFNPGVAFGVFAALPEQQRQIALTLTTLLALGVVLFLFVKDYKNDLKAQAALSLVVGGALGNVIDRFQHGQVIDFLDFYFGTYHWPAFNVADSAICVGVTFLILYSLIGSKAPAVLAESVSDRR